MNNVSTHTKGTLKGHGSRSRIFPVPDKSYVLRQRKYYDVLIIVFTLLLMVTRHMGSVQSQHLATYML